MSSPRLILILFHTRFQQPSVTWWGCEKEKERREFPTIIARIKGLSDYHLGWDNVRCNGDVTWCDELIKSYVTGDVRISFFPFCWRIGGRGVKNRSNQMHREKWWEVGDGSDFLKQTEESQNLLREKKRGASSSCSSCLFSIHFLLIQSYDNIDLQLCMHTIMMSSQINYTWVNLTI